MRRILLIISLIFGTVFPSYAEDKATQVASEQAEKTVVLYIEEMTCQLCVYLVNKELRAIEGVVSTKASMKDRKVNIVAKPDVDNQTLIQAVEKLHYSARVI